MVERLEWVGSFLWEALNAELDPWACLESEELARKTKNAGPWVYDETALCQLVVHSQKDTWRISLIHMRNRIKRAHLAVGGTL